jgi:hypothetical protein
LTVREHVVGGGLLGKVREWISGVDACHNAPGSAFSYNPLKRASLSAEGSISRGKTDTTRGAEQVTLRAADKGGGGSKPKPKHTHTHTLRDKCAEAHSVSQLTTSPPAPTSTGMLPSDMHSPSSSRSSSSSPLALLSARASQRSRHERPERPGS